MTRFYEEWSTAKKNFFGAGLQTADLPADFVLFINSGAGLGPALKKFDGADSYEKRVKVIGAVLKAKDEYAGEISGALRGTVVSDAKAALKGLQDGLLAIWRGVEREAQPPRPSGQMVKFQTLRSFNLAQGLRVKYLDVSATKVDVFIELDKTLLKLIEEGKESLRVEHLGNVAKTEVDNVRDRFVDTIKAIETKIETDLLDQRARDAKIREANEVLRYYARVVEDRVNAAVRTEWQKYLQRKQYLREFELKSTVKIVLGVIGIGVAAASIALSFGAMWMNVIAVAKGLSELVYNIKIRCEEMETTYKKLLEDMEHVAELNHERDEAKKKGQKKSKTKEALKELAVALSPLNKAILKSASAIEDRAKQFLGQVSKLESKADDVVGEINKAVALLNGLPDRMMSVAQTAAAAEMNTKLTELMKGVADMHRRAQNAAGFGDRCLKAIKKLRKEDSWSAGLTADVGGVSNKAVVLFALANFIFEAAKHGKSLIPI